MTIWDWLLLAAFVACPLFLAWHAWVAGSDSNGDGW